QSNVSVQFGAGHNLSVFQTVQQTFGNVTVTANTGSSFDLANGGGITIDGFIGGTVNVVTGNGRNDVAFHGTYVGSQVSYHGGNGGDNVDWEADATALNARLQFIFGAGNDTSPLNNTNYLSLFADAGF